MAQQDALADFVADLLVRVALAAGHELGLRLLAAFGPALSSEAIGRLWEALLARVRQLPAGVTPTLADLLVDGDGVTLPDALIILTGLEALPGTSLGADGTGPG